MAWMIIWANMVIWYWKSDVGKRQKRMNKPKPEMAKVLDEIADLLNEFKIVKYNFSASIPWVEQYMANKEVENRDSFAAGDERENCHFGTWNSLH